MTHELHGCYEFGTYSNDVTHDMCMDLRKVDMITSAQRDDIYTSLAEYRPKLIICQPNSSVFNPRFRSHMKRMSLEFIRKAFRVGQLQIKIIVDICSDAASNRRSFVCMQESNSWFNKSTDTMRLRQLRGVGEVVVSVVSNNVKTSVTVITNNKHILNSIKKDTTCQEIFIRHA